MPLNERQLKIVEYLKKETFITSTAYKDLFDITGRTALRDLTELIEFSIVKKEGDGKGTKYILE